MRLNTATIDSACKRLCICENCYAHRWKNFNGHGQCGRCRSYCPVKELTKFKFSCLVFSTMRKVSVTYGAIEQQKDVVGKLFAFVRFVFFWSCPCTLCSGGHFEPAHSYLGSTTILLDICGILIAYIWNSLTPYLILHIYCATAFGELLTSYTLYYQRVHLWSFHSLAFSTPLLCCCTCVSFAVLPCMSHFPSIVSIRHSVGFQLSCHCYTTVPSFHWRKLSFLIISNLTFSSWTYMYICGVGGGTFLEWMKVKCSAGSWPIVPFATVKVVLQFCAIREIPLAC